MSEQSTLRCLQFVSLYPGERRKAFMGYLYDFSEHKLGMKRAPFRLDTISRLIFEGLITSEGRVTLTARGRDELARLERRRDARRAKGGSLMSDKTCESWSAFPDGSEKTCGAPAKIMLNDFPCCEECFVEFEANGLVDKWEWIGISDPSPETTTIETAKPDPLVCRCGCCVMCGLKDGGATSDQASVKRRT